MKKILLLSSAIASLGFATASNAAIILGGDAASQASADSILDIVFAIDTSGSMSDDILAISTVARDVIEGLQCTDSNVYVRARFFGNVGAAAGVFDESLRGFILANGGTVPANFTDTEDNGPAVSSIISNSSLFFTDDSVGSQTYYKAVVSIGDEGTLNGSPVLADDWAAAYDANQAAIASDTLLFSWITDDPFAGVPALFEAMAEGGANPFGGAALGATGGTFVQSGASGGPDGIANTLQDIICTAGSGGTGVPDGGSTFLLLAPAVFGMFAFGRRMQKK